MPEGFGWAFLSLRAQRRGNIAFAMSKPALRVEDVTTMPHLKGHCATLVLCGWAVLYERANKLYMNCKQHKSIGKAMAANYYASPVQRDLENNLFISG